MQRIVSVLLIGLSVACSPYKKTTLTAGQYLTNRWKGADEITVTKAIGTYQSRAEEDKGFMMLFDYSYTLVNKNSTAVPVNKGLQVGNFDSKNNPILANKTPTYIPDNRNRSSENRVVKFMEFHFDSTRRVKYVYAEGFPDSVYYVKRN